MDHLKKIISHLLTDFRCAWKPLFAAHVVVSLVTSIALTLLTGVALNLFVALSDSDTVIADQDILYFFLTPVGLAAAVVSGAVAAAIFSLGYAALMTIGFHTVHGRHMGFRQAMVATVARGWDILWLSLKIIVRVLLIAAPFLAAAALVFKLLLTDYDINFYLTRKPPAFWLAGGLLGTIGAVMGFVLIRVAARWTFALPLLLFGNVPVSEALGESRQATLTRWWAITGWLAGWTAAGGILAGTVTGAINIVGRLIVPQMANNLGPLALTLGGLMVAGTLASFIVAFVNTAFLSLLVVRLYTDMMPRAGGVFPETETAGDPDGVTHRTMSMGKMVVLGGIVAAAATLAMGYHLLSDLRSEDRTDVIAHRGASAHAPENTMAAVERAIADGADWVEIDVQETADGQVVVIHDSDLKKVGGVDLKIAGSPMDRLQKVDIGSWFAPEFADQRLPSLGQVLQACKGRIRVNIELKYYGPNDRLAERVVGIVEASDMASNVVVMSLNFKGVQQVRALRPDWKVGFLTAVTVGDATKLDVDFLAVKGESATRSSVRRAHNKGKEIYAWTVNDPLGMSTLIGRGVDGIITDKPGLAVSVLAQRADLNLPERLLLELAGFFGITPEYLDQ